MKGEKHKGGGRRKAGKGKTTEMTTRLLIYCRNKEWKRETKDETRTRKTEEIQKED